MAILVLREKGEFQGLGLRPVGSTAPQHDVEVSYPGSPAECTCVLLRHQGLLEYAAYALWRPKQDIQTRDVFAALGEAIGVASCRPPLHLWLPTIRDHDPLIYRECGAAEIVLDITFNV